MENYEVYRKAFHKACNYFIKEVSLVGCEIIPKTEDSI